mmetsp:Transcript_26438/g.25587  ORF Transcript_26438/g.25587 Transcript_26438/m.25587 type:complete len:137 (+) Transcript_26438:132-542(+)
MDIRETSSHRLMFRKIPWPFWIMGSLFWAGAIFVIYIISEEIMVYKGVNQLYSYGLLMFMMGLGSLFIYSGKLKTTIFDKRKNMLIITKTLVTLNRTVKIYKLSEIKGVKAVERGYEKGQVNTRHFKIAIDFNSQP